MRTNLPALPLLLALLLLPRPAEGSPDPPPIVTPLAQSVRYDPLEIRLYLSVTGRAADGSLRHLERPLDMNQYGIYAAGAWVTPLPRYDVHHYHIVYKYAGRLWLVGSLETYVYKDTERPPVSLASLTVPWSFRPDTQEFEIDFHPKEWPPLEEWKSEGGPSPAGDGSPSDLEALRARALHGGDEAARRELAERGL